MWGKNDKDDKNDKNDGKAGPVVTNFSEAEELIIGY